MLSYLNQNIILPFIFILSLTGSANTTVVDSLKNRLVKAENLRDSVVLLYNIYDCSPAPLQGAILEDLYKLAMRSTSANTISVNDVLKQSSDHYATNDSMQQLLIERAKKLPEGTEKQSTLAYLNIIANTNQAQSLTPVQRECKLRDYLAQNTNYKEYDKYKRIEYLFLLCTYLQNSTEGELLTNYLKELQTLVDNLPSSDLAIRQLFYKQAADIYLSNGMISEAVGANKTLLNIIADLEKQDAAGGRTFRNYDESAFICYRRLLRCHEALSKNEIDEYYTKINSLINHIPGLRKQSDQQKKLNIYYLMAKSRYADAIPLIREQLKSQSNSDDEQLYLVDALIKASEAVGDNETLLMALDMSNNMLKNRIAKKATASYKELQTIYDVNDLKQTNDELQLTNQQIMIKRHNEQLIFAIICLVILVILLVTVVVLYRRSRLLTRHLTRSNAMITNERDALQRAQDDLIEASAKAKEANRIKTDFIKNMSHEIRTPLESIVEYSGLIADCADTESREYIKQFADIITLNSDLLLTIVNDVLDLPSLENAKVSVRIAESSIQRICNVAIANMTHRIKPDVQLIFANEGQADTIIKTDPRRVEQVLLNLLINAANFTDKGSITLEYAISSTRDNVIFTVTDTGIGIPDGKEDIIFSRFEKLNTTTQGNGLGLYISRLLARMLGGNLTLDKDYRKGAKFIFTIPIP